MLNPENLASSLPVYLLFHLTLNKLTIIMPTLYACLFQLAFIVWQFDKNVVDFDY